MALTTHAYALIPLQGLKRLAKLLATLLTAVGLFLVYLFFTAQGTKLALSAITELSPYQVKYNEINGTLATHLEFKAFRLKSARGEIAAEHLASSWDLRAILKGQYKFQTLNATNLTIFLPDKSQTNPNSLNLASIKQSIKKVLPFPFEIESLNIQKGVLYWQEQAHYFDHLILKRASSELTTLQEIHYQGALGIFDATLNQAIEAKWDLQLAENHYLGKYLKGQIKSRGHILLPKREFRDPQNYINIHIEAPQAHLLAQDLNQVIVEIKGTLAKHHLQLKGKVANHLLTSTLIGKLSKDKWQATIEELHFHHPRLNKHSNTNGEILLSWDDKAVHSQLDLLAWQRHPIKAKISVNKNKKHSLEGKIDANILELKNVASLFPDLEKVRGQLQIALKLGGSLKNIEYSGDITLQNANTRLNKWANNAFLNYLHFNLSPQKNIKVEGHGQWGTGKFSISGIGNWQQDFPTFNLALKGKNLLLSDTAEYYIIGDPDLELSLRKDHSTLKGKIFIPEAKIQSLKNTNIISPSEDVVIISHQKSSPATTATRFTEFATEIECILGDNVNYKGFGLTTKVLGKLTISQRTGQATNAKGKLALHQAKYRGYGKKFDIEYGQILFSGGPVSDPILDIRAQRKIVPAVEANQLENQIITAGIKLAGHLKAPKLTFYSIPSMNDADIISYLIVGRPQRNVNEAQAELLLEAISQLTYMVGEKRSDVQFDLAEKLKLDQIGFVKKSKATATPGANPLEDTALVLGKQLSDRLYMKYSVGLLDSANNVSLRYLLGKNVTVEASTGTQGSSADVLLSFDGR